MIEQSAVVVNTQQIFFFDSLNNAISKNWAFCALQHS
jgi:hypothetical protein